MPPLDQVVTNRRGRIGWKPRIFDAEEYGLHEHTVDQELRTICNRHLFHTPEPELESVEWDILRKNVRKLARAIGRVGRTPTRVLLEGRAGRRRKRFFEGAVRYANNGVGYQDSRITEMQKLEFYEESKLETKEDRGIQYRSVQYNVALAQHLHQIEERLIGLHHLGYHPIAKGLTPAQRCHRLFDFADEFDDPVFLCMDHSRFDAHINSQLLQLEHSVYLWCRKNHPELRKLLRWQRRNVGVSKGGIKYRIKAKRMSGDINTGLGNSLLNLSMILAWLEFIKVAKSRVMLDGDDSVVVMEWRDFSALPNSSVETFMLKLGMETEVEWTKDIWRVEFCQSRPVILPTKDGGFHPVFVRNPMKVVTTMGRTAESRDDRTLQLVMRSSALSELAVAPGAPVTNALAKRVMRYFGEGRIQRTTKQIYKEQAYGFNIEDVVIDEVPEPDNLARHTFWLAWDIEPTLQEMMENEDIHFCIKAQKDPRLRVPNIDCEEAPSEVWDLGQTFGKCDCGMCPVYSGQGCMRWVYK